LNSLKKSPDSSWIPIWWYLRWWWWIWRFRRLRRWRRPKTR